MDRSFMIWLIIQETSIICEKKLLEVIIFCRMISCTNLSLICPWQHPVSWTLLWFSFCIYRNECICYLSPSLHMCVCVCASYICLLVLVICYWKGYLMAFNEWGCQNVYMPWKLNIFSRWSSTGLGNYIKWCYNIYLEHTHCLYDFFNFIRFLTEI